MRHQMKTNIIYTLIEFAVNVELERNIGRIIPNIYTYLYDVLRLRFLPLNVWLSFDKAIPRRITH